MELLPHNDITIKDHVLIANQALVLRTPGRVKYPSTSDLGNWYFQIGVEPECENYNKIKRPFSSVTCNVILQGDTKAPATAMRVIEYALQGYIGKFMWAYLDDISIYSDTLADHIGHIQAVCQCVQEHKIIVSPKKYIFFAKRLNPLKHCIDEKGVRTDPEMI
jgi:hypothetical protein